MYFDDHNAVIVRVKEYNDSGITYEVNENEYDEFGNAIVCSHTIIVDNVIYSHEIKTYYEYIYDKYHRIIQKTRLDREGGVYEKIMNEFHGNLLVRKEIYMKWPDFSKPYRIHYYDYNNERLIQEKVCIRSGDVSYFVDYDEVDGNAIIKNPFRSGFA